MTHVYTYDTEFHEDGETIDLISIGIVPVSGLRAREGDRLETAYYAINEDADWGRIAKHKWLMDNVIPSLAPAVTIGVHPGPEQEQYLIVDREHPDVRPRRDIAYQLESFFGVGRFLDPATHTEPELWAYYADYDHVALCQLWGTMMNLPSGMPMLTLDIKQEHKMMLKRAALVGMDVNHMDERSGQMPAQPEGEHNALQDAVHNARRLEWLGVV